MGCRKSQKKQSGLTDAGIGLKAFGYGNICKFAC